MRGRAARRGVGERHFERNVQRAGGDVGDDHGLPRRDVAIELERKALAIGERDWLVLALALAVRDTELLERVPGLVPQPVGVDASQPRAFTFGLILDVRLRELRIHGLRETIRLRPRPRIGFDVQVILTGLLVGEHGDEAQRAPDLREGPAHGVEDLGIAELFAGEVRHTFALLHEAEQRRAVEVAGHAHDVVDEVSVEARRRRDDDVVVDALAHAVQRERAGSPRSQRSRSMNSKKCVSSVGRPAPARRPRVIVARNSLAM